MAKIPKTIRTIGPELEREIRRTIDQARRRVNGDLQAAPEPPPKAPDDYVVRTPVGGIPRRRHRKIYSRWCTVYKEVELNPAIRGYTKRLQKILDGNGAPLQLPVYNIYCEEVPGDLLVPTALLKSGTRYVTEWIECSSESSPSSSSPSSSSPSSSSPSSSSPSSSSPSSSLPSSSLLSSSSPSSSLPSSSSPSAPSASTPSEPSTSWASNSMAYEYWCRYEWLEGEGYVFTGTNAPGGCPYCVPHPYVYVGDVIYTPCSVP